MNLTRTEAVALLKRAGYHLADIFDDVHLEMKIKKLAATVDVETMRQALTGADLGTLAQIKRNGRLTIVADPTVTIAADPANFEKQMTKGTSNLEQVVRHNEELLRRAGYTKTAQIQDSSVWDRRPH